MCMYYNVMVIVTIALVLSFFINKQSSIIHTSFSDYYAIFFNNTL